MKRFVALLMALVLLFAAVACGSDKKAEKYCSSCGEGISKEVAFCEHCGAAVNGEQEEPATTSDNEGETTTVAGETQTGEESATTPPASTTTTPPPTTTARPTTTQAPTTTTPPVHSHSYTHNVTPPTCTEQGYTTHTCSCGHSYKDTYTNAGHNYSNYKCTKCGTVDKAHAYEYLKGWVLENGEASGEYVSINEYSDDYSVQYSLNYSSSQDYVYVSIMNENDANTSSDDGWISIYLDGNGPMFDYYCAYGYQPIEYDAIGTINGNTYTSNSPISCDSFTGNSNNRNWFMEYTRISVNWAIEFLDDYIDQCIPGITIKDLGFTAW